MPSSRPRSTCPQPLALALSSPPDLPFSQALGHCLAILGSFSPDRRSLGIADLVDDTGLRRFTTHRYVMMLLALGYLEQNSSRRYRLASREPSKRGQSR
jgi:hypothetical protein